MVPASVSGDRQCMERSLLVLFVVGLVLVASEFVIRHHRNMDIDLHDTWVSAGVGSLWFAAKAIGGYAGLIVVYRWISDQWAPWQLPLNNPLTWIGYWLVGDFFYYWVHRAEHRSRWMWASHVVHHSSTDFGFTTAIRMPPTEILYKPLTGLWAPLLGFPPAMYAAMAAWGLITGQLQHTRIVGSLGVLDRWLATPSNHRVHHGSNQRYLDKNFGGQTMIWDRICGTYEPESEPVVYGVTEPLAGTRVRDVALGGYPALWQARRNRRLESAGAAV